MSQRLTLASACGVAFLACAASAASARPSDGAAACGTVGHLKEAYLACERRAQHRGMDGGEAALCARIYELLKRRGFDGDFSALYAWYVAARESEAPMSVRCD